MHPRFRTGLGQGLMSGMVISMLSVQQAGIGSDLGPASTEEGQTNELGWELPAYSWVATYFAGCQMRGCGGGTCASYTEKGCPKSCPWHSASQGHLPVLTGVSKFFLLRIRDFWYCRDSQGFLLEEFLAGMRMGLLLFYLAEVWLCGCVFQSYLQTGRWCVKMYEGFHPWFTPK